MPTAADMAANPYANEMKPDARGTNSPALEKLTDAPTRPFTPSAASDKHRMTIPAGRIAFYPPNAEGKPSRSAAEETKAAPAGLASA